LLVVLVAVAAGSLALAQEDTYRVAYDAGYADGADLGRQDHEQGRPFDFANHRSYQSGDRGYTSGVQDRDVYVVAYRRGFEDGYEEGFGLTASSPEPAPIPTVADEPRASSPPDVRQVGSDAMELPAGTEIKIKLLDSLTTDRNEKGDRLRAEVIQDVMAGQDVAIPESSAASKGAPR
jgi:hypothetical protein